MHWRDVHIACLHNLLWISYLIIVYHAMVLEWSYQGKGTGNWFWSAERSQLSRHEYTFLFRNKIYFARRFLAAQVAICGFVQIMGGRSRTQAVYKRWFWASQCSSYLGTEISTWSIFDMSGWVGWPGGQGGWIIWINQVR